MDIVSSMPENMGNTKKLLSDRYLISIIGDRDTVTGFLLAGIGQKDSSQRKNFFIVDHKTTVSEIEQTFKDLTERKDIAILLIDQQAANMIRYLIDNYTNRFPTILEIPSKDNPYDPECDSLMKNIQKAFSSE